MVHSTLHDYRSNLIGSAVNLDTNLTGRL